MKSINTSYIWGKISTFYDSATERTREKLEYFWEGLTALSDEMKNQAQRFIDATDPERAQVNPVLKFVSIEIDILKSRPMPIDATNKNGRTVFIPKQIQSNKNDEGISQDIVEVTQDIYKTFNETAVGRYIVIATAATEKYFRITGFISRPGYWAIQTDGNLSFVLKGSKVQARITTGQTYDIDPYIIDIPWLRNTVMDDSLGAIRLTRGINYTVEDSTVRFHNDIIAGAVVENQDSLFCEEVPTIEDNLFNGYGALTGLVNWKRFGNDGLGARTAVSAMMKALQNPSQHRDYVTGLSVTLGLPLAPDRGVVKGVYEAFDYEVVEKNGNEIVFATNGLDSLHGFIQVGTKMIVGSTLLEVDVATVVDRSLCTITLVDADGVGVGDVLNVRLAQKLRLTGVKKISGNRTFFSVSHWTNMGEFEHVINKTAANKKPLLFIGENGQYDGVYHAHSIDVDGSTKWVGICDEHEVDTEPIYNDYTADVIAETVLASGFIHMPWPTQKYILLELGDGTMYKAHVDSAVDVILDEGDGVDKYDSLTRCISVCNQTQFPQWNEYDGFEKFNGIGKDLGYLNIVWRIPDSKTGTLFPN
jgi:hypothetical protein